MKINFEHKGNFTKLEQYLIKTAHSKSVIKSILDKYGKRGVEELRKATPKDTGKTSESWTYEIVENSKGKYEIIWSNNNVVNGWANVAILLQYGHATKNGGFVKGQDYINPAIDKVFQGLAEEAWEEVKQHGNNS